MKKYMKYMGFGLMLAALSACNKFLDREPISQLPERAAFIDENSMKLYLNSLYPMLPFPNYNADNNSDNMVPISANSFLNGTYVKPVSDGGWSWGNLRAINYFLRNYHAASVSQESKNKYAGEARLLRAIFYYDKVRIFGDVPWLSTDLTPESPELYGARVSRKIVMDSVLMDLDFAIANLPLPSAVEKGRLNKYVAEAFKSRICLFEGTFRKYHQLGDEQKFLEAAASSAKNIIESDIYKIYSTGKPNEDYSNLFLSEDLTNNTECIFAKIYIADILMHNFTRYIKENGEGYSKNFVQSYLCTDGLPISLSPQYKGDDSPDNEATNRDPRYKQSIATRGYVMLTDLSGRPVDVIDLPRIGTSVTSTGYAISKGVSANPNQNTANRATNDLFVFRYAEVLLNYAEARAELGTISQSDIDMAIKPLRDRVGMPNMVIANLQKDPRSDFPSLPVVLDEIRRERRVELIGEGRRFTDLLRWAAGKQIEKPETILGMKVTEDLARQYPPSQLQGLTFDANRYLRIYSNINQRTWNDRMYFYPLPTNDIALNPSLEQNPGW
ncbi:RagB/SusD family nutrient uptake outer membrane protein [Sphingobacterium spiritivorum]|uniref:RagB/SusD family nutrient uptake outer membrane protein n=1 Tax=Sphingobacterium spiritivorum TaxID=258 RepID=UPI003DA1F82F